MWSHSTVLFIYLSVMSIWVLSAFCLLWIKLLWTSVYKFLHEHMFSSLLGTDLGVELLGYKVTLSLTFWGSARLFFKVAISFYTPRNVCRLKFFHAGVSLDNICYCLFCFVCHPRYEVVSHCGFNLPLTND